MVENQSSMPATMEEEEREEEREGWWLICQLSHVIPIDIESTTSTSWGSSVASSCVNFTGATQFKTTPRCYSVIKKGQN
jgi:hypothetical protein